MVKFLDVDPLVLEELREPRRGRVSYPLLKSFLETGKFLVKVDRTGMQQNLQGLQQSLRSYIRNHSMPIKMFIHKGELYFMRLDIDSQGNAIPDWSQSGEPVAGEASPITPGEVAKRFADEKHKSTK